MSRHFHLPISKGTTSGWIDVAGKRAIQMDYPWEEVPLVIKTIELEYRIWIVVRSEDGTHIGRFSIENGLYEITNCLDKTPLENLPDVPDNIRIWTLIMNGNDGFTIKCNGVLVAELELTGLTKCAQSYWRTETVATISFNPDWDRSKAFRGL